MAIQEITGSETGNEFVGKLNNNFSQGSNIRSVAIKMERGGLKDTGAMDYTISSYNGYVRSSMLIKIDAASKVNGLNLHGFSIYQYDENFNKLPSTKSEGDTFDSSCKYIKIFKQTNDAVSEKEIFFFDGDVEEVYNVQIEKSTSSTLKSATLVFDVGEDVCTTARLSLPSNYVIKGKKVPLMIWSACDGSYPNWNFSIDYVGSTPSSIKSALLYLLSQGFAVLNVYPWGSYNFSHFPNCGQSGAVPVPVTLRAHEKAVEYVTTRFNISETNIFLTSWSGSGKISAYYAIHRPTFNLRSIYAFAPVVDGATFRLSGEKLNDGTGFRGAANSEMHFVGSQQDINNYLSRWGDTINTQAEIDFVKANVEKFAKYSSIKWQNLVGCYMKNGELHNHNVDDKIADSVAWGNAWRQAINYNSTPSDFAGWDDLEGTIYNRYELAITNDGVPITIIGAKDDAACPYLAMKEFIIQLQNGGAEANIVTLPNETEANGGIGTGHDNTLGHRAPIFYNSVVQYGGNNVGYGWWYAVQDIKARFLKN